MEHLGTRDALARWIEAHDRGERLRSLRVPRPPGLPMPAAEPRVDRTVLGTVLEGDSLTHVTYREVQRLRADLVVEQAVRSLSLRRIGRG